MRHWACESLLLSPFFCPYNSLIIFLLAASMASASMDAR